MKSLRSAAFKAKEGPEANEEAEAVKEMGEQMREVEERLRKIGKDAVRWADEVRALMLALDGWAHSFGKVIWMGNEDGQSEVFNAFLELITEQLLPRSTMAC